MGFLYYIIIAIFVSLFLTYEYMRGISKNLKEASQKQIRGAVAIAFIINLILAPIALAEYLITKFRKWRNKTK